VSTLNLRRLAVTVMGAALCLSLAPAVAAADPVATVVVGGLNNPRGIDIGANGRIVVAETGAGRVLGVAADGTTTTLMSGLPVLSSPEEGATGVHNVSLTGNGNLFVVTGEAEPGNPEAFWTLFRKPSRGAARVVAEIDSYQAADPDPADVDVPAFPTQSNPYGLETIGASKVLVTDAGNNDLLLVDGSTITTVARFPTQMVGTDHIPFPFPFPEIPAEAVPTTIAVGPDGYWYVGELKGAPFRPGSSNIWRIAPSARGATCDADTSDGCSLWMTGFTGITGMEFGPDGSLYVAEMIKNGLFAFFVGGDTVGALWRVKGASKTELAAGELHVLADVAVARSGTVYVTTGSVFPDGAVMRINP
jgi:hypothetical protein